MTKKEKDIKDFYMQILNAVNEACGNPWDFSLITLSGAGQVKAVDQNYVPNANKYKREIKATNLDKNGVYVFSGAGEDNICKNIKIQSKIPNEMQAMAYYSNMGVGSEKGSKVQMFNMYRAGVQDGLKKLARTVIVGGHSGEADNAEANGTLIWSYCELLGITRTEVEKNKSSKPHVREGKSIAADFVRKYIHGDTTVVNTYRPPIPIDVSLELHGLSGIYMGNALMIRTQAEGGMLPSRYQDVVALQTTEVNHTISPEGWNTSIETLMRPLPDTPAKNKFKASANVPPIPPVSHKNYTGMTPNADYLRDVVASLDFKIKSYIEGGYRAPSSKVKVKVIYDELTSIAGVTEDMKGKAVTSIMRDGTPPNGDLTKEVVRFAAAVLREIKKTTDYNIKLCAGNDYFHHDPSLDYSSRHIYGNAVDFVVTKANGGSPDAEVLDVVEEILRGFSVGEYNYIRYKDEYGSPTKMATGAHFHMSYGKGTEGNAEISVAKTKAAPTYTGDDKVKPRFVSDHVPEWESKPRSDGKTGTDGLWD